MVPYCVNTITGTVGCVSCTPLQQLQAAGVLQHQVRQQDVYRRVLQDLQSFFRRGHRGRFHSALLRHLRAGLPDRRLVIDDQRCSSTPLRAPPPLLRSWLARYGLPSRYSPCILSTISGTYSHPDSYISTLMYCTRQTIPFPLPFWRPVRPFVCPSCLSPLPPTVSLFSNVGHSDLVPFPFSEPSPSHPFRKQNGLSETFLEEPVLLSLAATSSPLPA